MATLASGEDGLKTRFNEKVTATFATGEDNVKTTCREPRIRPAGDCKKFTYLWPRKHPARFSDFILE
jgi:hypothetical protein